MTAVFEKFKSRSTHAQPVETKEQEWKGFMIDEDPRNMIDEDPRNMKLYAAFKAAAIFSGVAFVGLSLVPALAAVAPVMLGGGLGLSGFSYVGAAKLQAQIRSYSENEKEGRLYDHPTRRQLAKNTAKYLIKPF